MSSAPAPTLTLPRDCTFSPSDWAVLSRFWHPVAFAGEVRADKPLEARLLDQRLVLWREAPGAPATVAADLCAHRGAPLSMGRVCGGRLACPYHGYEYDAAGRCTRIPAHPGGAIPGRLGLRVFASVERHGIVWARLAGGEGGEGGAGPGARGPAEFPEAADARFQVVEVPPLDWAAAAGRQVESFCDVAHFAFVHPETFAVGDPAVPGYAVETVEGEVRADFSSRAGNVSDASAAGRVWRRVYRITPPFTAHLVVHFPDGGRLAILNAACPVSARRTRVFPVVARDFDHDKPVSELIAFQRRVYAEDQAVVERQWPEDLPVDLGEEVHVRADRTSVEYRRLLGKLGLGRGFTA